MNKKKTTKKQPKKKDISKVESSEVAEPKVDETQQPPRSLISILWASKVSIILALLSVLATKVKFTEKKVYEDNFFVYKYYFKNRYYSPLFWVFLTIVCIYAFLSGGIPAFLDSIKDNFTEEDSTIYTLTGTFTDHHLKQSTLTKKLMEFITIYGGSWY